MTAYWLGALDQRLYPGAGDIDDCWVVATLWSFRYQTHMATAALPSITVFRDAADNPDKPGPTGGRNSQIALALNRLYPGQPYARFESNSSAGWSSFMAQLKGGASASVVVLSSLLPSGLQFGFKGLHRASVVWLDGTLVMMNPLQRNGAPLIPIGETALRRAMAGATTDGWFLAVMFPPMNRGTYAIRSYSSGVPRPYRRYRRTASGTWRSERRWTRGLSGVAMPPDHFTIAGHTGSFVLVCSGVNAGWWVEITTGRKFTP